MTRGDWVRRPRHEVIGALAGGMRFEVKPGETAGDLIARAQATAVTCRVVLLFGRRGER